MKKLILGIFSVILIALIATIPACKTTEPKVVEGIKVNNFGLFDHTGDFHRLYYHDNASAIVLFVQGNGCPIVRNAVTDFQQVADNFQKDGVKFFMINSNVQDTRATVKEEADQFKMNIPILMDQSQLVADLLDIDITAECFVLNPKDWSISYRGPINDRVGYESQKNEAKNHYLKDAIAKTIAGEVIENRFVNTKGCAVSRLQKNEDYSDVTYTDDIGMIFAEKCFRCHQEGGIAPWAMESFNHVFGWSAMIKNVLLEQRMPPWQADPHVGVFDNDISITQEEKRKILAWIDNGRPKGEGEDPLAGLTPEASNWTKGEPDLIIELNQEDIPATGIIDYRYQTHTLRFDEDKYVSAYQVIPGNPSVLHHVLATIEYPNGEKFPVENRKSEWLDGIFVGWAPGGEPETFPEGTARKIPKGSSIRFQLHYTTSGKEESDQSTIGIYFADEKPEKEYITIGPANFRIKIPPHDPAAKFAAVEPIDEDIILYDLFPHMHYRGKAMNFVLQHPDGKEEMLLNVPGYNFNWQRFYSLKEPVFVKAGSKIIVNAVYDNSENNDFNPDPEKTLYFGDQTFDEMLVGYISFTRGHGTDDLSSTD